MPATRLFEGKEHINYDDREGVEHSKKRKQVKKRMQISFVLLCFLLFLSHSLGFKLDWLPSSADGPLPLSSSYRNKLRRLCQQIEGRVQEGRSLAPEIEDKREVIDKMCAKLLSDDENIEMGSKEAFSEAARGIAQKVIIVVVVCLVIHQVSQTNMARRIQNHVKQIYEHLTYKPNRAERRANGAGASSSQQMASKMASSAWSPFSNDGHGDTTVDAREARLRRFAAATGSEAS